MGQIQKHEIIIFTVVIGGGAVLAWFNQEHAAEIMVAAGTLALAAVTYFLVLQSRAEAQQNREEARGNRQAQLRPLLIPQTHGLSPDIWEQPTGSVIPYVNLCNAGPGVATNIWGLLLRPEEPRTAGHPPRQFYVRGALPIASDAERTFEFSDGGTAFTPEDSLAGYSLSPPGPGWGVHLEKPWDSHGRYVHRLTLTYHDIQGNKHASIFDLTGTGVWVTVAVLHDIPEDLRTMDLAKGDVYRKEIPPSEVYA